ncbi:hypothetical protein LLG46_03695 [bacterium]|nr:hypothetical protein [bacterium]
MTNAAPHAPAYDLIPDELKALRQWVCYRIEDRDGTPTKVPYRTDKVGRGNAKTNNPATWHTFEEVIEAAAKPKNRFDGIGFVLSEEDPYIFIDLDHVVAEGEVEPWAREIIGRIGSYTEFSRSETGIHIIARAKKPGPRCRTAKHPKFEIYSDRRLVVFTGKLLPSAAAEITDAERAMAAIYRSMFGDKPDNDVPPKENVKNAKPNGMSDPVLIQRALSASNGEKFRKLWNGDIGDYNSDASAADSALCCMLAYWTDKDPVRMDRLFRESGLIRPKWDELHGAQTYGQMTIDAAIGIVKETCADHAGKRRQRKRRASGDAEGAKPQAHPAASNGLLTIYADCQDLRSVTAVCWRAIIYANNPPKYFRYIGLPSRLEKDDDGTLVPRELTPDRLRHELARVANWVSGEDEEAAKPPIDVVRDVLATPNPPLPVLTRITDVPVFAPDGSLQTAEGYHAAGKTYRMSRPGLNIPEISSPPSQEEVDAAGSLILDMISDFPFVDEADRAHAVGLLLLPFVRDLIDGPTPNHLIEAPQAGTGKGLLADVLLTPACGKQVSTISEARDDDEWRKRITAQLRSARSVVLLDNITRPLNSGSLASALTATIWEDRILGKSENLHFPVRCVWVTTANNPTMSTEIARRCIRIRLDAKVDRPWFRDGFKQKKLRNWALDSRGELVGAALTLVQAWICAGMPASEAKPLGSYEQWTAIIGGILQHSGISGFLSNLHEFYEAADIEGAMWRQIVDAWWEKFGQEKVGVTDLFELVSEIDALDLGKGGERSQRIAFGRRLGQQRDRVIGEYRIVSAGKSKRISQWMLAPTTNLFSEDGEGVYVVHKGVCSPTTPHARTYMHAGAHTHEECIENIHQHTRHTPSEQTDESDSIDNTREDGSSPGYEEF